MNAAAPFLLIDAGNSRIKWAFADADGHRTHEGALAHDDAPVTGGTTVPAPAQPGDPGLAAWDNLPAPGSIWISNVAGAATAERLAALIDARWPAAPRTTIRAQAEQCGVVNGYAAPASLGSDRWAGMIGARAAFPDEHLLIATFGTATTLEALRADGRFEGGLIAPGWAMMMRSLGEHTAQLPTLDADAARELLQTGASPFAADTPRSLSAGCALAQTGLVERAWRELQSNWRAPVRLVVGGGAADAVAALLEVPHTRRDALVLSGLALIAASAVARS